MQLAAVVLAALPWAALLEPSRRAADAALLGPASLVGTLDEASPSPDAPRAAGFLVAAGVAVRPGPLPRPALAARARPAGRATARLYLSFSRLQTDGG